MAFPGRPPANKASRAESRPAPRSQPPVQQNRSFAENSGRFERGLERRWEQAWNRARSAGGA